MLGYIAIVPTWDIFTCPSCFVIPAWQTACLGCFLVLKYLIHRSSQQSPRPFFKRKLWSAKRLHKVTQEPNFSQADPKPVPFLTPSCSEGTGDDNVFRCICR